MKNFLKFTVCFILIFSLVGCSKKKEVSLKERIENSKDLIIIEETDGSITCNYDGNEDLYGVCIYEERINPQKLTSDIVIEINNKPYKFPKGTFIQGALKDEGIRVSLQFTANKNGFNITKVKVLDISNYYYYKVGNEIINVDTDMNFVKRY